MTFRDLRDNVGAFLGMGGLLVCFCAFVWAAMEHGISGTPFARQMFHYGFLSFLLGLLIAPSRENPRSRL